MFRPTLLPAISHGITYVVDYPAESMLTYAIFIPIVYQFPLKMKAALLVGASIYHLREDIPGGIVGNVIMHMAWFKFPLFAELYLSFIHTPRHYSRTMGKEMFIKIIWIKMITIFALLEMIFQWTSGFRDLWWVGPVLAHIYMTDIHAKKVRNSQLEENIDTQLL
jgi:hypothetical protein